MGRFSLSFKPSNTIARHLNLVSFSWRPRFTPHSVRYQCTCITIWWHCAI